MVDIEWMGKSSIIALLTFRVHVLTDGFVFIAVSSAFRTGHVFGDQPDLEFRGLMGLGRIGWQRKASQQESINLATCCETQISGTQGCYCICHMRPLNVTFQDVPVFLLGFRVFIFPSWDLPQRIRLLVLVARRETITAKMASTMADPAGGRTRASKILEQECRDYTPIYGDYGSCWSYVSTHQDHQGPPFRLVFEDDRTAKYRNKES